MRDDGLPVATAPRPGRLRRRLCTTVAIGLAASALTPSPAIAATGGDQSLKVGTVTRTYRVHAPSNATAKGARPALVVVLHGAGATATEIERRYRWDALADRKRFVVAYPQGVGRRWNPDLLPGAADDVGFARALIDTLTRRYHVDPGRVFVTGISNGGIMTYRLGCELALVVTAIAPVAAWPASCTPAEPVSLLHIHGLADTALPFSGGFGSAPVSTGITAWRTADACPGAGTTARTNDDVSDTTWGPCAQGTVVELVTIGDGRHEWPGAIPKPGNDPVSHAIDATTRIWAFFAAHHR